MEKVGRNEPCPCGSGRKYKRCCRAKDEEARLAAPAEEEPAEEEPEAEQVPFEALLARPNPDPADLYDSYLVRREALSRSGDFAGVMSLIELVRQERPAAFDAQAAWYAWDYLEAALVSRRDANMDPCLAVVFARPEQHLDIGFKVADTLTYYGRTGPLLRAMRAAWPAVTGAVQVPRKTANQFAARVAELLIYEHLAGDPGLASLDDLAAALAPYAEVERPWLEAIVTHADGQVQRTWRAADFGSDLTEEERERNLSLLITDFAHGLHARHGFTVGKAGMAAGELEEYLRGRHHRVGRKPDPAGVAPAWLVPGRDSIDQRLGAMMDIWAFQTYRAAALWEAVPHYLAFLHELALIDDARYKTATENLQSLQPAIVRTVGRSRHDPNLSVALATCWDAAAQPETSHPA